MKNKKAVKKANVTKNVLEIISMEASKTDPNGSYTGTPINPNEVPVQDADDL